MTPLAARLFRASSDRETRKALLASQFFECSPLYNLAKEMIAEDIEAGCDVYSEMAQLPAPKSVVEFMMGGNRLMLFAEQIESIIRYSAYLSDKRTGAVFALESGFQLGTPMNLEPKWNDEVRSKWASSAGMAPKNFGDQQAEGINGLLEKILCMMNQTGLIEHNEHRTHTPRAAGDAGSREPCRSYDGVL